MESQGRVKSPEISKLEVGVCQVRKILPLDRQVGLFKHRSNPTRDRLLANVTSVEPLCVHFADI